MERRIVVKQEGNNEEVKVFMSKEDWDLWKGIHVKLDNQDGNPLLVMFTVEIKECKCRMEMIKEKEHITSLSAMMTYTDFDEPQKENYMVVHELVLMEFLPDIMELPWLTEEEAELCRAIYTAWNDRFFKGTKLGEDLLN